MDTDSATEQLIKREKMRALKRAVRRGKNNYEEDLLELAQALQNAGDNSKIAEVLNDKLTQTLNNKSIVSDFEGCIDDITIYT